MNNPFDTRAFWALVARMAYVPNVGLFCADGRVALMPGQNYDVRRDPNSPFYVKPTA